MVSFLPVLLVRSSSHILPWDVRWNKSDSMTDTFTRIPIPACRIVRGEPRVEKYRPNTLDDVVSHKDITGTSRFSSLSQQPVDKVFFTMSRQLIRIERNV
jgi:hypothetical protein